MFSYSAKNDSLTKANGNNALFFQPKLTINQPNDMYEQEANTVADKVMQESSASTTFFSPRLKFLKAIGTSISKNVLVFSDC